MSACNREGKYRLIFQPSLPCPSSSAAIHIYYSLLYSTFLFCTPRLVKRGEEKISGTRLLFKALCYALGHSHHTLAPMGGSLWTASTRKPTLSLSNTCQLKKTFLAERPQRRHLSLTILRSYNISFMFSLWKGCKNLKRVHLIFWCNWFRSTNL